VSLLILSLTLIVLIAFDTHIENIDVSVVSDLIKPFHDAIHMNRDGFTYPMIIGVIDCNKDARLRIVAPAQDTGAVLRENKFCRAHVFFS